VGALVYGREQIEVYGALERRGSLVGKQRVEHDICRGHRLGRHRFLPANAYGGESRSPHAGQYIKSMHPVAWYEDLLIVPFFGMSSDLHLWTLATDG
jgi:hypothetical protein